MIAYLFSLAIRCIPYFMEVTSTFDTKIKRHWAEKIKTSVQILENEWY